MNKLFNQNSVKISYSCLPSIGRRLAALNSKKLNSDKERLENNNEGECRCRGVCPVEGQCKSSNIIYCATIKTFENGKNKIAKYFGQTATTFIVRYRNHKHSFGNKKLIKSTELSKFIWDLKTRNINYEINWEIIRKASPYQPGGKFCHLCTSEGIAIGFYQGTEELINSKDEVITRCRHRAKWKLENY